MSGFCDLLPIAATKRGEPLYRKADSDAMCVALIKSDIYFSEVAKNMTQDTQKATSLLDDVNKEFSVALERFASTNKRFMDESKRASSSVRESADKLAQGLARIEKTANFNNLERYVALLERAASAMTVLAELEKTGKLEKIASAIR